MQPEIWIGTVEISFTDADKPNDVKRAFTVVTTWASNFEEFNQKCVLMLESYGWKLLGVEAAIPLPQNAVFGDEVEDMLEQTRVNEAAIIHGAFDTYYVM
jgi:hypothetical protein